MATGTTNLQLLNAIHELDKKVDSHLALIAGQEKRTNTLEKDIYDSDQGGIKFQNKTMWQERSEKKGVAKEVKVAIVIGIVNGLLATGNIFNIF